MFGRFARAAEESSERLFVRIFRTGFLNVPHAKGNMPAGNDDNVILGVNGLHFWFVYANIAQYSVDEACGECCFTRVMNLAFKV